VCPNAVGLAIRAQAVDRERGYLMRRPALDFGNSGVVRFYCDACSKPITLCYMGSNGEYCSRACLERSDAKRSLESVDTRYASKEVTSNGSKSPKVTVSGKVTESAPSTRLKRRIARRKLMKVIRSEMVSSLGREPSISEMQRELEKRGQRASHRTVWKDLTRLRAAR
jgi:hypothetical protein